MNFDTRPGQRQTPPTAAASVRDDLAFDGLLHGEKLKFKTTWGIFSPKQIDEGTGLLADRMEVGANDDCLDLGCGYGPLGLLMAKLAPGGQTHLIDKDFVAIDYSNLNAKLNNLSNAKAYLSNGFSAIPKSQKFDIIASNIPAKIGSELLGIFLADAHARLNPGGKLYVVTISGLKDYMKRQLTTQFGNYDKLGQSRTYTAAVAIKQ